MDSEGGSRITELDIFKEALIDDYPSIQLDAIKRLPSLAQSLGIVKTLDTLLPLLSDCIDAIQDEALCFLPEQLEKFSPLVGGCENTSLILNILVKLSKSDENLVRCNAIDALNHICNEFDDDTCEQLFYPLIEQLTSNDWFTSKCSAAGLFAICYQKMNDDKRAELRNMFRNLVQDESPMVRRAAEDGLVEFIKILEVEYVNSEFLPVFHNLALDPQDSVRVLAVDVGIAITKKINHHETYESLILTTLKQLCVDTSWKVRRKIASKIDEIQSLSLEKTRDEVLMMYQICTKDFEAEVRSVAAENLYVYTVALKESFKNDDLFEKKIHDDVMTLIRNMITDENEDVRLALSNNILSLSTILTSESFNTNILPLILETLENEESMGFKENILRNLNSLPMDVDISKSFKSVSKVVENLLGNSKQHWRTRRNLLIAFVHIMKTSTVEFFTENLQQYYINLLNDEIFAIRRTSCLILPLLMKKFGYYWSQEVLVPNIEKIANDSHYIIRLVALFAINEFIHPTLEPDHEDGNNNPAGKYLTHYYNNPDKLSKSLQLVNLLEVRIVNIMNKLPRHDDYESIFSCNDMKLYGEDTLEILKTNQIESIFSSHDENDNTTEIDYLTGVLLILNRNLIDTVELLVNDPIENVRNRAEFTLKLIERFCVKINDEKDSLEWVNSAIGQLTDDSILRIREEIDNYLTTFTATVPEPELDRNEEKIEEELQPEPLVQEGEEVIKTELDANESVEIGENVLETPKNQ